MIPLGTIVRCEKCGLYRTDGHPIPHCSQCERKEYDATFAELRAQVSQTHLLGVDPYSDSIYVWANGVVVAIEGRVDRALRLRSADGLVSRIAELEAENREVLAENARMRRRLDGPK